jgi:hypothetical protein
MGMRGGGARGCVGGGGGRPRSSYRMIYVPSFFSTSLFLVVEIGSKILSVTAMLN